jgi:fused signal recognition particle receptor
MAFNFLKKVFSFGAKPEEIKQDAPAPASEPVAAAEPELAEAQRSPLEIVPQPEPQSEPDPVSPGTDSYPDVPHDPPIGVALEEVTSLADEEVAAQPRLESAGEVHPTPDLRSELPGQAAGLARPSAPPQGEGKAAGRVTVAKSVEVLIRADLGMETAIRITGALSAGRFGRDVSDAEVRAVMAAEVEKVLKPVALPLELDLSHKPHVVLVVGVNGTGKTTTIGKLAAKLTGGGLKVTLAAGDTFRAAAIEQLKIWGERTGSPVVSSKLGADAAGLAFDAYEKAKAAGSDVLIIDTAGRLQNKTELMAELEKIVRVLGKHDPDAPHTVLQTVDATTGQNALNQVEIFRNVAGVNGLVMTKLDGSARGGILVAIAAKHKLPVYFIGVGEQVDDLEPFDAGDFAKAIAGVA